MTPSITLIQVQTPLNALIGDLFRVQDAFETVISSDTVQQQQAKEALEEVKRDTDYHELKEDIQHIISDIQHGAGIVVKILKELSAFATSREGEENTMVTRVSVRDTINTAMLLIKGKLTNDTTIHVKHDDLLDVVDTNKGKLNELILHLLRNAVEALPEKKGTVTIATNNFEDTFQVIFSDDGIGIPADIMPSLKKPMFTTKHDEKHRGMGLTIANNIAQAFGGDIEINSTEGNGTTVTVTMPKIQKQKVQNV